MPGHSQNRFAVPTGGVVGMGLVTSFFFLSKWRRGKLAGRVLPSQPSHGAQRGPPREEVDGKGQLSCGRPPPEVARELRASKVAQPRGPARSAASVRGRLVLFPPTGSVVSSGASPPSKFPGRRVRLPASRHGTGSFDARASSLSVERKRVDVAARHGQDATAVLGPANVYVEEECQRYFCYLSQVSRVRDRPHSDPLPGRVLRPCVLLHMPVRSICGRQAQQRRRSTTRTAPHVVIVF